MKFKVGDKVRILDNVYDDDKFTIKGMEGVVTEVFGPDHIQGYMVAGNAALEQHAPTDEQFHWAFYQHELELIG